MVAIEELPDDLRGIVQRLHTLNTQIEECRQAIYKKQCLLLKTSPAPPQNSTTNPPHGGEAKSIVLGEGSDSQKNDENTQQRMKKLDKDYSKLDDLLQAKSAGDRELQSLLEKTFRRFQREMSKQHEVDMSPPQYFFAGDCDVESLETALDEAQKLLLSPPEYLSGHR